MAMGKEEPYLLENFFKDLQTLQADFTQSVYNASGKKLEQVSGVVYLRRPGQFHWQYQQPYLQTIVSDGTTLWVYDEDLEQVNIRNINEHLQNTPAVIFRGKQEIEKYFVVTDLGSTEGINLLDLSPKAETDQYNNIRLGFEGDRLVMMVLFDNLGQVTRIDFNNEKKNPALAMDIFKFVIPEGIDVIDERQ